MSKKHNSRKEKFIGSIAPFSLQDQDVWSDISGRCRFNFSYFDANQEHATDMRTWDEANLQQFFSKLISYCRHPLSHWQQQTVGSHRHHVLEIYGAFPRKSGFRPPLHVPSDVDWARFRLDQRKRLIGFTIPKSYCTSGSHFDDNTFYSVFLDLEHQFYLGDR